MAKIRLNEPRSVRAGGVSIETTGDVIELDTSVDLVSGAATALRDAIAAGIRGISASVSPATLVYREKAKRAFERGAAWAVARYGGGREPGSSSRLFNDSGELAAGIGVTVGPDGASVTVPADRLGDLPGAPPGSTLERLRTLVPALAAPLDVPGVREAIAAAWARLVTLTR